MKIYFAALVKSLTLGCAAIAILSLGQVARADEVTISGNTNGCFGANCTPTGTNGVQQTTTLLGLTYNNSVFSGTTSNGFLGIGNTGQPPGNQNVNNLGSFTLSADPNNYNGQSFTLLVTFTAPPGIVGSNSSTFTAELIGSVTSSTQGGVFVNFDNTPRTFTFSGPGGSGSFTFNVNDVSVIAGGTVAVTGNITAAQQRTTVPEPGTLLLFGTGLSGIAAGLRKRYRSNKNA